MIGVQSNHDVEYFGCPAAPNCCKIVGKKVKIKPILKPSSQTEISYAGGDKIMNGRFKVKGRVLCSSQVAK